MSTDTEKIRHSQMQGMDSIEIIGAFDYNDIAVDDIVRDVISQGKKGLVFNLSQTSYITSAGIASLIKALKKMQGVNGTLYIFGATQDMIEFLQMTNLGSYLQFI